MTTAVIGVVIILAAILLNGLVATVEDDLPGGFNNPEGTNTPRYINKLNALSGIVVIALALGIATVGFFALPDPGTAILFWGIAISLSVFSLPKIWPTTFRWRPWISLVPLTLTFVVVHLLS
jgi:hypothetical protein